MKTALLSATGKRWLTENIASGSAESLVVQLLRKRNLGDAETALPTEDLFPQMASAVDRIRKAIIEKQTIAIFGDYDCDGITAAVQLVRFFERRSVTPILRLPHRERDGYGLNMGIVDELAEHGAELVITVDTGVTAIEEIFYAKQKGIDTIVTDHHALPESLPDACAILHPACSAAYPTPHPSGAGVAYQLVSALEKGEWDGKEVDSIFAMIGTIADVVELTGENRRIVQQGLECLTQTSYAPLLQLMEVSGIDQASVSSTDIAFRIAPRINASGRIGEPLKAVDALLYGGEAVQQLDALNKDRQSMTQQCMEEAMQSIDADSPPPLLHILDTECPPGIVGLIAGKLTEQCGRPSMVATLQDDMCTASLRSLRCFDITEALTRHKDLLERFGGHAQAAGCTVQKEHWQELCRRLTEDIQAHTTPEDLLPTLEVDAELELKTLSTNFVKSLMRLEPYGQGNREPLFLLHNVTLEVPRCVGSDNTHLQCSIGGRKAIGFHLGNLIDLCTQPLDVVCRITLDTWQGKTAPQIIIVDVRPTV